MRIPYVALASLNSPVAVQEVSNLKPDLAVHAGAGIMRPALLAVPRLGTLNAHMGVLPFYRGMNVTEWAAFNGDPVGCTVHWIDSGIGTGDIVCVRLIDPRACRSVSELRAMVNRAQLDLLGDVVDYISRTGRPLPVRRQNPEEGRQFFRMHPELLEILENELRTSTKRCG